MSSKTKTTAAKKGKFTTERRRLKAHENLIIQVIKRQAGTLSKAVLEGVMNSIDAFDKMERGGMPMPERPTIEVTIKAGLLIISDNALGFESAESIKQVFEIFGNPHELDDNGISKDAKFGTFRIGRGQMFAFGRNTWRSNSFQMVTDIDNWELDYDLTSGLPERPGCTIAVELYDALRPSAIQQTIDEVTKYCRYVPYHLTINGQLITDDPAKKRWDLVTEDAYINKKVSENRWRASSGLDVYQQGVFVQSFPASKFGLEGTVVIRKAVQVNFARNEIVERCKHWQKIVKLLQVEGVKEAQRKPRLTSAEARSFVEKFSNGEMVSYDDFWNTACLPDTNGKMWSCKAMLALVYSTARSPRVLRGPQGEIRVAFAERGNRHADRAMQLRKGIVFDQALIAQLGADRPGLSRKEQEEEVLQILRGVSPLAGVDHAHDNFRGKLVRVEVEQLLENVRTDYFLVDKDDFTQREKDFIAAAFTIMWSLSYKNGRDYTNRDLRDLIIGESGMADGWTDGKSYVAVSRKFLAGLNLGLERDWQKAAMLLLHEMCHDGDDMSTHTHTPEFYEDYHDLSRNISDRGREAYRAYRAKMQKRAGKLTKALQSQLHIEAETYVMSELAYRPVEKEAARA